MELFQLLDTNGTPRGKDSPLGLVFVDGNHAFDYALFDLMRSAGHVSPGGVIVADDLNQTGPREAILQFLRWNPSWSLVCNGTAISSADLDGDRINDTWGVLVAPAGLQVARQPYSTSGQCPEYKDIKALRLNITRVSHPGTLHANMNYAAIPYDYHLTGEGAASVRGQSQVFISAPGDDILLEFESSLQLGSPKGNYHIRYELELSFVSDSAATAFIFLNPESCLELVAS